MESKSKRKNSPSWQRQNTSVSADGVEWVAHSLQQALPYHSLEFLPRCSRPQFLLSDDRGSADVPLYVGVAVKTATESYQFSCPKLASSQQDEHICIFACRSYGHVWVRERSDVQIRENTTVRMFGHDALGISSAARIVGDMVETNDKLARFSKSEWVRRSGKQGTNHDRGRNLLAELLRFPIFEELKFFGDNTDNRHNALLRDRKILYRPQAARSATQLFDPRRSTPTISADDEIDALLILVADVAAPSSLRHVGLLSKSVLFGRGFLAADGERGKSALWVRRDLDFTGTMMEGLEPHFLDVVNASTADFEDFFQKNLGSF